jgi:hypothetical protein
VFLDWDNHLSHTIWLGIRLSCVHPWLVPSSCRLHGQWDKLWQFQSPGSHEICDPDYICQSWLTYTFTPLTNYNDVDQRWQCSTKANWSGNGKDRMLEVTTVTKTGVLNHQGGELHHYHCYDIPVTMATLTKKIPYLLWLFRYVPDMHLISEGNTLLRTSRDLTIRLSQILRTSSVQTWWWPSSYVSGLWRNRFHHMCSTLYTYINLRS